MTNGMYTIYDVKAEAYLAPFFARTDGEAIRMILNALEDPQTMLAKYPLDYKLVKVGTWDNQVGKVAACDMLDLGTCHYLQCVEKKRYDDANKDVSDEN